MPSKRGRPNKVYAAYVTVVNGMVYAFKEGNFLDIGYPAHDLDYYEAREQVMKYAARTPVHD